MLRAISVLVALMLVWGAHAAEMVFDFSQFRLHEMPEGFRSALTGAGKAGDWQVVLDRAPSAFPSLPNKGPELVEQSVLGQLSRERIDDRFPMLIYEGEIFDDFVLHTRIKLVAGQDEQLAGIAFRIQAEQD